MSHKMEDLKEMICRELEEIADKGELSAGDLDTIYKLIVSKEKLLRIDEIEEDMEGGYSRNGYSMNGDYANRGGDWEARGSYRRGRGYSGEDGYSGRGRHYVRGHYSYADSKQMLSDLMNSEELTSSQKNAMRKIMEDM